MILDIGSFGDIIRTHVLTRLGRKWRHNKIHELMRMAEAMRRKDNKIFCKGYLFEIKIIFLRSENQWWFHHYHDGFDSFEIKMTFIRSKHLQWFYCSHDVTVDVDSGGVEGWEQEEEARLSFSRLPGAWHRETHTPHHERWEGAQLWVWDPRLSITVWISIKYNGKRVPHFKTHRFAHKVHHSFVELYIFINTTFNTDYCHWWMISGV